jgi:hypothetical protein
VDEAVVGDLVPGEQRADDLDALGQPGVALGLRGPAVARDVLVGGLSRPEADPQAPGNISTSVAIACATIAGW